MFIVCILGLDMTDYKHSVTVTLTFDQGVKKWVFFLPCNIFKNRNILLMSFTKL